MKLNKNIITIIAFLTVLIFATPSFARLGQRGQRGGQRGGQFGNPENQKRMDTVRLLKLVETLNLDDKQALKMSKIFKNHREAQDKIRTSITEIFNEIKTRVDKGLKDNNVELPDNAKILIKHIEAYKIAISKMAKERERHINEVFEMLTPIQKAKFIIFQENFPKEFRKKMRDFRRSRRPGPSVQNNPSIDPNAE